MAVNPPSGNLAVFALTLVIAALKRERLWTKLRGMGFPEPVIAMFEKAFGRIAGTLRGDDGDQSELVNFLHGVKQGDPLSSLFFILFIADLKDFLRSNKATGHDVVTPELALNILLICFADDTTLIADDTFQ
jgi:hypothetical protein